LIWFAKRFPGWGEGQPSLAGNNRIGEALKKREGRKAPCGRKDARKEGEKMAFYKTWQREGGDLTMKGG